MKKGSPNDKDSLLALGPRRKRTAFIGKATQNRSNKEDSNTHPSLEDGEALLHPNGQGG